MLMRLTTGIKQPVMWIIMESIIQLMRGHECIMCSLRTMQHVILIRDAGQCILKPRFFLPLSPAHFLLGVTEDTPKPGTTPSPDTPDRQPSLPETPGAGRGRARYRDPDHDRPRRGRTPEEERRNYRHPGGPREDEEEEHRNPSGTLEDRLRQLLEKWERDLEHLRERLRLDLLTL
ncbi:E4 protein [Bos taurus papillomavirus 24]|nr:E4 protein [Bos taurus papillomavirus 24]